MTGMVAGIGFRAILGGVVGKAASAGGSALKWLGSLDLVHALLLAVALFGGWQTFGRWSQHRHTVKVEGQLAGCTKARATDAATYVKGQADATTLNLAHNAADKAARERITNDVSQSYEAQLVSLRADLARRLRAPTAATPGAASQSDLPNVSPAPSGPDGTARLSVPTSLYVRGAELELQLEKLQQWITEQVKVDPNKDTSK